MTTIVTSDILDGQSFGVVLRLLRAESGKSGVEVARIVGISASVLYKLETDQQPAHISLDKLCQLLAVYGRAIQLDEAAQL